MLTSTINPYPCAVPGSGSGSDALSTPPTNTKPTTANTAPTPLSSATPASLYPGSSPHHHRRNTRSEDLDRDLDRDRDLDILSHAQGQMREHLEPLGGVVPHALVQGHFHAQLPETGLRARSATDSHAAAPSARRAFRRWERGLGAGEGEAGGVDGRSARVDASSDLDFANANANANSNVNRFSGNASSFSYYPRFNSAGDAGDGGDGEEEDIRPSIEPPDDPTPSSSPRIRPTVETPLHARLSPVRDVRTHRGKEASAGRAQRTSGPEHRISGAERGTDGGEVQAWDEAQRWSGYVRYRESWVRRAGLKRKGGGEKETGEEGEGKRGRV